MDFNEEEFDAVIVGSGFGGSVMAYNLQKAGLNVCVLERGKSYAPGDFARTPDQLKEAVWDPSNGLLGIFNIWSFKDFDSVVSSGLGGGSLIYANVLLKKNESWFKGWPVTRRDLDPHYDNVLQVIEHSPYPSSVDPYNQTPKANALKGSESVSNLKFVPVELAISFGKESDKPVPGEELKYDGNLHKSKRFACRLCGECYFGCNYGSKNTLDFNYLSHAKKAGATVRTLSEVVSFEPVNDSTYVIKYRDLSVPVKRGTPCDLKVIKCKYLVLSAGTFGSTYLLLKNKAKFPRISKMLGKKFSGNGDLFTVADGTRNKDKSMENLKPYLGPTITGALMSDGDTDEKRFYIEDWSYPQTLIWLVEAMRFGTFARKWWRILSNYIAIRVGFRMNPDIDSDISEFLDDERSTVYSFPMVGMGMEKPGGSMKLTKDSYLDVEYPRSDSIGFFRNILAEMQKISKSLAAKNFIDFPTWYLGKTVTVHPLGGCPMGSDENSGVVDSYGEVFNYPNFFIADGSVVPTSIGPNPSLTIAALSDRFSGRIIEHNIDKLAVIGATNGP